jgi:hypothetical protein
MNNFEQYKQIQTDGANYDCDPLVCGPRIRGTISPRIIGWEYCRINHSGNCAGPRGIQDQLV